MRFSLGYVDTDAEMTILADQNEAHPLDALSACVTREEVLALKLAVGAIRISDELKRYIVDLVAGTRKRRQGFKWAPALVRH